MCCIHKSSYSGHILKPEANQEPCAAVKRGYLYTCPMKDVTFNLSTIHRSNKLTRCLSCHLQSGVPKHHIGEGYDITLIKGMLNNNHLYNKAQDVRRLKVLEVLHIKIECTINT